MLAVTVVLLLHSVTPFHSALDLHYGRATQRIISINAPTVAFTQKPSMSTLEKGNVLSKIVVIPAYARALPPLQRANSHFKGSNAGLFHKFGGNRAGSQIKTNGTPKYIYPDSDFSFQTDPHPATRQQ